MQENFKRKRISELIKSFKDSNLKDYVLNIIGTGPMLKQLSDENQIYQIYVFMVKWIILKLLK